MSEKELIKQEIERRIELLEPLECEYNNGSIDAYKGILQFIDSLPEEPKKQPKFKIGDTIKGPCNNIFQVKEVLDKQYLLHSENGDELNSIEIVDANSCIVEEPSCEKKDYRERYKRIAQTEQFKQSYCNKSLGKEESTSEDLEEAASKYVREDFHERSRADFKAGAEWQKRKDKETIELAEDHAMLAGMNKMKEEMMKDAVRATIDYPLIGYDFPNIYPNYRELKDYCDNHGIKDNDKVKLIIIEDKA